MEKDKSIDLQKQVRDNAEDLQKEFLDMKNWEEQMREADSQLKNSYDDFTQTLPPVRKKKNNARTKPKAKENGSKAKRIKASDYGAWDQYDADKACEEVDKENESEDSGEEILSKEELEKNHAEATKHKIMGNNYVKDQKWDKAMACYNEAIKIFPYDAVFYANRALCHLKMDNLYSAEADCTSAIQRDEYYIKAYHRRATARMALKQYNEAIQDLKQLLSLDSDNKEAQKMLSSALKSLNNSKPIILTSKNSESESKIYEDRIKAKNAILKFVQERIGQDAKSTSEESDKCDMHEELQGSIKSPKIHDWVPKIDGDAEVVQSIQKLPHQRLNNKPLRSIPIEIIDFSKCTKVNDKKFDNLLDLSTRSTDKLLKINSMQKSKENDVGAYADYKDVEIPIIPRSAVQFFSTWNEYKSPLFRYKYLKQLPPESISKIFQDSMESKIFSDILTILKTHFMPNHDGVFQYLKYLSEIKRFRMLIMFLRKCEKEDLNTLFDYCKNVEGHPDDLITKYRHKYEI